MTIAYDSGPGPSRASTAASSAAALLGCEAGDDVVLQRPGGASTLTLLAIG